jgi:hypothetical protein
VRGFLIALHESVLEKRISKAVLWTTHQRFFLQLVLAFKVDDIFKIVEEGLTRHQSIVIGLFSTGEAQLENLLEDAKRKRTTTKIMSTKSNGENDGITRTRKKTKTNEQGDSEQFLNEEEGKKEGEKETETGLRNDGRRQHLQRKGKRKAALNHEIEKEKGNEKAKGKQPRKRTRKSHNNDEDEDNDLEDDELLTQVMINDNYDDDLEDDEILTQVMINDNSDDEEEDDEIVTRGENEGETNNNVNNNNNNDTKSRKPFCGNQLSTPKKMTQRLLEKW